MEERRKWQEQTAKLAEITTEVMAERDAALAELAEANRGLRIVWQQHDELAEELAETLARAEKAEAHADQEWIAHALHDHIDVLQAQLEDAEAVLEEAEPDDGEPFWDKLDAYRARYPKEEK